VTTTKKMLRCPHCGDGDHIVLHARTWYHVKDPGQGDPDWVELTEAEDVADGPFSYDDDTPAGCQKCDWNGTYKEVWA
jgi:hypothetical protein